MTFEIAEIHARTPRHDNPRRIERTLEAIAHDRLGHQGRNLDANVAHLIAVIRQSGAFDHALQPVLGEVPGQE